MTHPFPSLGWLASLKETINSDVQYAQIAASWEGDLLFAVEPDDQSNGHQQVVYFYLDLWHGQCREIRMFHPNEENLPEARFTLRATRENLLRILNGELEAIQAMMTRRLKVQGSMAYMLRNVPTVVDFVRCARKVGLDPHAPWQAEVQG